MVVMMMMLMRDGRVGVVVAVVVAADISDRLEMRMPVAQLILKTQGTVIGDHAVAVVTGDDDDVVVIMVNVVIPRGASDVISYVVDATSDDINIVVIGVISGARGVVVDGRRSSKFGDGDRFQRRR